MAEFPEGLIPIPIHNSDVQSFKGCRERWNWVSDLREGWKPIDTPTPLSFGSAIHAGEEVYYNPDTWSLVQRGGPYRDAVIAAAIQAFEEYMRKTKARFLKLTQQETLDEADRERWEEHFKLGRGMLLHYFEWVQKADIDAGLEPVGVEVPFEVPVFDDHTEQVLYLGSWSKDYIVVFRGRIDLLVRDKHNRLWILDHKTTARMPDKLLFLEMDEQMGSYILGASLALEERIAGAIYNEILKGYPVPPQRNKTQRLGRWYSINQNQYTSYAVYKKTLEENGEDPELYADFLNWLKSYGPTYVRRTEIPRNTTELMNLRQRIKLTVIDMLTDPYIYPSPGRWACDYCPFRDACLAKMEGQDVQWILETTCIKEQRTNA